MIILYKLPFRQRNQNKGMKAYDDVLKWFLSEKFRGSWSKQSVSLNEKTANWKNAIYSSVHAG